MSDGDVHTRPADDLIEHATDGSDCICIPEVIPVEREDGSIGYVYVHHSLDGRELEAMPEGPSPTVRALKAFQERVRARLADEAH